MTNSALTKTHQASDVSLLFTMLSMLLKEAEEHPQNFWQLAIIVQGWALSAQLFSTSVHLQSDIIRALSDSLHGDTPASLPQPKNKALSDKTLDLPALSDGHHEPIENTTDDEEDKIADIWLHA